MIRLRFANVQPHAPGTNIVGHTVTQGNFTIIGHNGADYPEEHFFIRIDDGNVLLSVTNRQRQHVK